MVLGPRFLPSTKCDDVQNNVTSIAILKGNSTESKVVVSTVTGISIINTFPYTLEQKALELENLMVRHNRQIGVGNSTGGVVGDCGLSDFGFFIY